MNRNARRALAWFFIPVVMVSTGMGGSQCTSTSLDTNGRACLDATQFEGKFTEPSGTNATTTDFSGDWSQQEAGGNTLVTSTSGSRKITFIVPNLSTATYDLSTTYLAYTEKVGNNTNVWKATSGTLRVLVCSIGITVSSTEAPMSPFQPGNTNAAAGTFKLAVFQRKL